MSELMFNTCIIMINISLKMLQSYFSRHAEHCAYGGGLAGPGSFLAFSLWRARPLRGARRARNSEKPARQGLRQDAYRLAVEKGLDRLDRASEIGAVVLLHDVAEVRGEDDVIKRAQRMLDGQWLDIEDVEAGARDTLFAQRGDERRFLDDRPARCVDEVGAALHQAELSGAYKAARARRQLEVDREEIGAAEQVVAAHRLDAGFLASFRREVL